MSHAPLHPRLMVPLHLLLPPRLHLLPLLIQIHQKNLNLKFNIFHYCFIL